MERKRALEFRANQKVSAEANATQRFHVGCCAARVGPTQIAKTPRATWIVAPAECLPPSPNGWCCMEWSRSPECAHACNHRPPSSRTIAPVINDASSASHATHFAASIAVPARFIGVRSMYLA